MLLISEGKDIVASEEDKYQFIIKIASGELKFEEIKMWLQSKIKRV